MDVDMRTMFGGKDRTLNSKTDNKTICQHNNKDRVIKIPKQ